MIDKVKANFISILFEHKDYFLPICFNEDWNTLYAIDKYRLAEILESRQWRIHCETTFINEIVYSCIITLESPIPSQDILNFTDIAETKNIQIFVNHEDMVKIKDQIFQDQKDSEFWKKIE